MRGYTRPMDWHSLWAWEQTGQGLAVFANGGAIVLFGLDVDVFRLVAKGLGDAEVATQLRISERKVSTLRRDFARRLGAATAPDLAHIASSYPQLQ